VHPTPKHAAPSRLAGWSRGTRRSLAVASVVLAALAAGVVVQLTRPLALPALVPGAQEDPPPGSAPALPWPTTGQGAASVPALGLMVRSGPERPVPVASLTKMMTAYVVLQAHPLSPEERGPVLTMTSADEAQSAAQAEAGDTTLPLVAGEQLDERQMLDGLLVRSADNLADVLATWVAGSVSAFVGEMDTTADALGMHATHYADPSGLDANSVSTAGDALILAAAAMRIPAFAAAVDQQTVTLPIVGTVPNYVRSIGTGGIVGVKSGYTEAAEGCVVLATHRTVAGRDILVLAATTGQGGADPLQVAEGATRAVLDAAAGALGTRPVVAAGSVVAVLRARWGATVDVVADTGADVVAWPGQHVRIAVVPRDAVGPRPHLVVTAGSEVVIAQVHRSGALAGPSLLWRLAHG
jgi:serine-type D-Ala-D-Ala carboxypeptidase (penicillin-binding protein 5/6)